MTSKIKLLPDVLINKIAAGEVIERPASVVKELVENSLDAGACKISVSISEGGLSRIEVNDDGVGMNREDLKLAVQRHATSKLAQPEDLFNIHSFGFRGEALPSIISVSNCTIKSRTRESDSGYMLSIEGGHIKEEMETGCDYGTFISVRNLFYNTPARRKFLKSASAEVRAVIKVAEGLSLANPRTEFVVESDTQRLLDLPSAEDKFERAKQLFGYSLENKFIIGEKSGGQVKVEIYISKPEICRKNRSRVMLLVNGRRIESKALFAALISAYGEFLTGRMYPQGVVFVTVDPALVDVNVHPAKSEVRFSDERIIYHLLYHLVRETLLSGQAVPGYSGIDSTGNTRQSIRNFFQAKSGRGEISEESLATMFTNRDPDTGGEVPSTLHQASGIIEENIADRSPGVSSLKMDSVLRGDIRLHQMAGLYIIAVTYDSVLIVDQHAAHERILYELALKAYHTNAITGQRLLFPVTIHLEPEDFLTLEKEKDSLAALGFTISDFGPRQIQLEAIPAILGERNPEILLRELLDDFSTLTGDEEKRYKKKAASFACRGAIMAGDRLNETSMRELLENLLVTENPYICPHGRPTMIKISRDELDVKFGRL